MGNVGCTPQSLPKFQHPSHELLKENGFTQHVYHKYRRRCLNGTHTYTHIHMHAHTTCTLLFPSLLSLVLTHHFFFFSFILSSHIYLLLLLSLNKLLHLISLSPPIRAKEAGNRPIAGDEHALPLLVVFPAGSLQQEDVRRVQTAGGRRRERRIQVRTTSQYCVFDI